MSAVLAALVISGWSAAAQSPQPPFEAYFQLETTITTRTARVGDIVPLRTASDFVVDGVRIRVGTAARGVVTRAARPGRIRGRARLEIEVESITRPDGSLIRATGTIVPAPRVGRTFPPPEQHLSIMLGMAAGYGTAAMVSEHSQDTQKIARSGIIAGLGTGLAIGILQRGEELVLRSGQTVPVLLTLSAAAAPCCSSPRDR